MIHNRRRISGHLVSAMHLLLLSSSFITTALAQEQIELGTGNYYVDLQTGTSCVRDCNPPNIENCGGIVGAEASWLQMFSTIDECCTTKLSWIDISVCAPPLEDSSLTTAASTATTTTTSATTQEELYDVGVSTDYNGDGQFNQLDVDIANSNPISPIDFDSINTNTNINCPTPDVDCMSGLWNTLTCVCDCIPPYCADSINGACREATGCVGRPWGECIMGVTCPWWKTIFYTATTVKGEEESALCQSGTDIPPGVYVLYASQQECELKVSSSDMNAVVLGNNPTGFEVVTLKFTVDGLPSSIIPSDDIDILEEEMEYVTRWALTTLAEQLGDSLIIKGIEKKKNSTMIEEGGDMDVIANDGSSIGEMTTSSNVYYDITLVQRNGGEEYGPIIITGLKDLYPKIMEMIAESSSRLYLVYGVELFWCYDEDGDDMIYNTYVMCSANTETVAYTIRFDNVPLISQNQTLTTSDWDTLIDEVIGDYKNTLQGVDRLDIVDMKIVGVINLHPDDGDATTYTKDVKLDIVVVDRLATDFSPIIKSTLLNTKSSTLKLIQSSDTSTKLNLSWCVNDNGQFTECSKRLNDDADDKGRLILRDVTMGAVVLPVWAIIVFAGACVVVFCCTCWCLLAYLNQRDESKNERNMVTYINTGHNFSQTNATKTKRQKTMIQKRRTRTIARHRSTKTRPIQRHDDLENGDDHHNHHHDPSFVDEVEEIAIVQPIDTLYMEQMPSFVFVNDEEEDYNNNDEEDEDDGPSYSYKPDPEGILKYSNN